MKAHFNKAVLSLSLILCPFLVFSQLPYSPCSPAGGKKADILGVETKYRAPGGATPTFTIPAGTKSVVVYVSSETGINDGTDENDRGDEDFITINAIIDLPSNTSSGFVNYAKNTWNNGIGTNVYGWRKVPLGAFIPDASKVGDKTPNLNNVNFTVAGNTLTIAENATGIHSSFHVEYISPTTNSFDPLPTEIRSIGNGSATINRDLMIPIPAGANVISISGKGTNTSNVDLNSSNGSEEGYSNMHFIIDLDAAKTNGFLTLANGGSPDRRSTYVISDLNSTTVTDFFSSGAVTGDYLAKNTDSGAVGTYNPQIYVSGSDLVIKRDASYARDFDDSYVIEFYTRVGQGMSAEFIDSDIRNIVKSTYPPTGVAKTFKIPSGTNFIYFNETANATNLNIESNENPLAAYAYIDLNKETATGYFYQQVGSSKATGRRDHNYAFKDVPLDGSNTSTAPNTVGFQGRFPYDISFSLSPDKSELTVTNLTGLANETYQFLLWADFFGARPDLAFNPANITFTKGSSCNKVKVNLDVCNPGAGNSTGGLPVAFYLGNPTTDPGARLLHLDVIDQAIAMGDCKTFSFELDFGALSGATADINVVMNDDGSFVNGGVGNVVNTPFTLASLAIQNPFYTECYYDNNLFSRTIPIISCPVTDPDPDNSSGAGGAYDYVTTFSAGSTTGVEIVDNDVTIIAPDGGTITTATITLTNILDAGQESLRLNGTLPAGISISGDGTGTIILSGTASKADYIAAIRMIEYFNANGTPNTADRHITTVLNDGIDDGPVANTTVRILVDPAINVRGNGISIADNSTTTNTPDGTNFGTIPSGTTVLTQTFNIENVGTGILSLTGTPVVAITGDVGFTVATQPATTSLSAAANTSFIVHFDPAGHAGGTYAATIKITNTDADPDKADYTYVVNIVINNPPTVSNGIVTGNEDNTLAFAGTDFTTHFTDADGDVLNKIKINSLPQNGNFLLNGTPVTIGQEIPAAQLANITFLPTANWSGSTTFDWVAADGTAYATTPATTTININPVDDAPVVTVPASIAVTEGVATPLENISFTDIDAGNANVTVTLSVPQGAIAATSGSGVTVSGTSGALVLTGTLSDINAFIAANSVTYTIGQNPPATVILTVNISDNGNTGSGGPLQDTKTITLNITSVNLPPTGNDDSKTTPEGTPVNGTVTGNDPDGDALTFTKATDPANGTVTVLPDGSYTYTPDAGFTGGDSFTITVSDGRGGTDVITVDITVTPAIPANNPPTGNNDAKTTPQDVPVSGTITGSDPDGDALTFIKATNPANGSATVNPDGTYTYTPNAGFSGTDNFTVTISDGKGGTVTITVTIDVTPVIPPNNPPTGNNDAKITPQDVPVNGTLTGNDPDGDALTFTKATDPANGTVTVNPDGTYTYTPDPGYTGGDSFTVTISDGNGGTTTVTVNITVTPVVPANRPPAGNNDNKTTPQDVPVDGTVIGTDPDGDALTFIKATSPANGTATVNPDGTYTYTPNAGFTGTDNFDVIISDGRGGVATITVTIDVTPVAPNNPPTGNNDNKTTPQDVPVNGTLTASDPDGDILTFTKATDPANGTVTVNPDGTYTYIPDPGYTGGDSFTVTISDGNGGTTTVTVNISVTPVVPANNPPAGTGDTKTTPQDTPVSGAVTGTDPDGDALTFTKATDPAHGTVVVNPDGTYTYTPVAGYNGGDSFTVTISDGKGGTTTVTVNITVTPVIAAPVAVDDKAETKANTPVTIPVLGNDNAGNSTLDETSVEVIIQPAHGSVTVKEDGTIVYTPAAGYSGEDVFTYRVKNANGQFSNVATVTVTITATTVNVPNLFTPNGDGKNDYFEIRGLNQYAENELVIVNRWGNEVYRQKGYTNTWTGEGLNEGTYYYLLRIRRNSDAEWQVIKGYVTLIRTFKK